MKSLYISSIFAACDSLTGKCDNSWEEYHEKNNNQWSEHRLAILSNCPQHLEDWYNKSVQRRTMKPHNMWSCGSNSGEPIAGEAAVAAGCVSVAHGGGAWLHAATAASLQHCLLPGSWVPGTPAPTVATVARQCQHQVCRVHYCPQLLVWLTLLYNMHGGRYTRMYAIIITSNDKF